MKLKKIKLCNFRSYEEEIEIGINDLNVIVGKNDVGKSTILEALDIFFNEDNGLIKIDIEDKNVNTAENISITCCFEVNGSRPITIDTNVNTTLNEEFLLNQEELLEVKKEWDCSKGKLTKTSLKTYLICNYPNALSDKPLPTQKIADLKKIIRDKGIEVENQTISSCCRRAIYDHFDTVEKSHLTINVDKEGGKDIWEKIKKDLPLFSLFQADRANRDSDKEVQDPLKVITKQAIDEVKDKLDEVKQQIEEKAKDIGERTIEMLNEMNPELADTLVPEMSSKAWDTLFSFSFRGDDNIPINKRGSGVRRMILLNYFRAEAEKRRNNRNVPDIIYAIEEPETSQHPSHQRILIDALETLSLSDHTQVILTTHSPEIVKQLEFEHLKVIVNNEHKEIINVERNTLPYPSLNEVNYLAFGYTSEEYHNELYGFLESIMKVAPYNNTQGKVQYIQMNRDGSAKDPAPKSMTEYIRHQIHHPENDLNTRFTDDQLNESVAAMRSYIIENDILNLNHGNSTE